MKKTPAAALALLLPTLAACAASGPVVPAPPSVEVGDYGSQVITPDVIRFGAEVLIRNRMRGPLEIERVDYCVDLQGAPLFEDSFAELHPMGSLVTQTVSLPFQVAMDDVLARIDGVLVEEAVRVTFRGSVHPVGFAPIPFEAEQEIPIPRLPEVELDGIHGSPFDGEVTVVVRVRNRNDFPMTIAEVDTYLDLNGQRYGLLRNDSCSELAPSGTGRLVLTMTHTRGKGLGAIISVAKNGTADFAVGGSLACRTPYGLLYLPLQLRSSSTFAFAR